VEKEVGFGVPTRFNVKEGYVEGIGRVLLSTRSFNPGDIVLTDKPLVQYKNDLADWHLDLVKKYARMNAKERASIMDFKHLSTPEDAEYSECRDYMQEFWILAEYLVASEPELHSCSQADVFKLMTCHIFNVQAGRLASGTACSALYPLLSRAAHSCSPNCFATSQPCKPQEYAFMAIKPIAPGEVLTISYTEGYQSVISRRSKLRSAVLPIVDPKLVPLAPLLAPYHFYWIIQTSSPVIF
jgi:hypothetical protein